MMHEFRLPSLTDPSLPQKKPLEKTIPPNVRNLNAVIFEKETVAIYLLNTKLGV
jgi:hypothetical protein